MALNPIKELKRRLEDEDIPLPKRLCLAQHAVLAGHLPVAPSERVVAEWLQTLATLAPEDAFRCALNLIQRIDEPTNEMKSRCIRIVSKYLQDNATKDTSALDVLNFVENEKILSQLNSQVEDFLLIAKKLLVTLGSSHTEENTLFTCRILNNIVKYHKEVKRKLEFILKFINSQLIEIVFAYLESAELRESALNVCLTILFPASKKSFYVSFLQTLIRKENIDELVEEKGDNIQSVLKIMSTFFTFPKGRSSNDCKFLYQYIDAFVSCFKEDAHLVFAFYIMFVNCLNVQQAYINPTVSMPTIYFEENNEKTKRIVFLKALEYLLTNEVDVNIKLTDTFGEKATKVEIKKNFASFLQASMMCLLKLEGKPDKITLNIIKTALKLDPMLIEQKIDQILPSIMAAKKTNPAIMESYIEMLNLLLEIMFKLSRGTLFINQIIPSVKIHLEAMNTEQFEMTQKLAALGEDDPEHNKLEAKILKGQDLFPVACVEKYGKLTSELMFRQSGELFVSLQRDFEEQCLMLLSDGFVSPSLIILAEVLGAILCSVLEHSKMADHAVLSFVSDDFWTNFGNFEGDVLGKYGECLLKLSYKKELMLSFLSLSLSYSKLKLLHCQYGNVSDSSSDSSEDVFDLSAVLPCLNEEQWASVASKVKDNEDVDSAEVLNKLLIHKLIHCKRVILDAEEISDASISTKTYLITEIVSNMTLLRSCGYYARTLFTDLNRTQMKQLSKSFLKHFLQNQDLEILKNVTAINNKDLLSALALETFKNITKMLESDIFVAKYISLSRSIAKSNYNFIDICKELDSVPQYFDELSKISENCDFEVMLSCTDVLKELKICYLDESCQLTHLFVLLAVKKALWHSKSTGTIKKIKRNIDFLLLSLFELSPRYPDVYKVFPIEYIFSFDDNSFLKLVTLSKTKTSNRFLIIKVILETALKKIKTDSEVVKSIVRILLAKQKNKKDGNSSIEYFSNEVFQVTCIILPIIARDKKALTVSAYRSILADLQEKLHKSLLKSFKSVDFSHEKSLFLNTTDDADKSVAGNASESTLATLNAIEAYSLTLSKYCESNEAEDLQNLDCLWSSLEYFIQNAILATQNMEAKWQHVDASLQLFIVVLRNIRKLAAHDLFLNRDKLFLQMWQCLKARCLIVYSEKNRGTNQKRFVNDSCLENIAVTIKWLCELSGVEFFNANVATDLTNLVALKNPKSIVKKTNSTLTAHRVAKFLLSACLKANIVGPKCAALSKCVYRTCKNLAQWIRVHYGSQHLSQKRPNAHDEQNTLGKNSVWLQEDEDSEIQTTCVKVDDMVCEILKCDLDCLAETIMSAKKITLNYKTLDTVFELQQLVLSLLGAVTLPAHLMLLDGVLAVLNGLLLARGELLEDRWPCYLQCYCALVTGVCLPESEEHGAEEKMSERAHALEKLTQAICKRKAQVSRLAAYAVANICATLELQSPAWPIRQHLENCTALLMQASDSTHATGFLRRALANNPGHATLNTMFATYNSYHKYSGTS